MRKLLLAICLLTAFSFAQGPEYWSVDGLRLDQDVKTIPWIPASMKTGDQLHGITVPGHPSIEVVKGKITKINQGKEVRGVSSPSVVVRVGDPRARVEQMLGKPDRDIVGTGGPDAFQNYIYFKKGLEVIMTRGQVASIGLSRYPVRKER